MPGKVKVTATGDVGRLRVITQQQEPGGSWGSGTAVNEDLDVKKGAEFEIQPNTRVVIEEIG